MSVVRTTTRTRERGMTLLELMISMTILAFMMIIAWSTLLQTTSAKKNFEKVQDRYREVRQALSRIERDLSMAYLSGNEDQLLVDKRTMFVADRYSGMARLAFSAFAHVRFYAEAAESDQTVIAYFVADDPEAKAGGQRNLYRFEAARLAAERWEQLPGEADVLLSNIEKFEITFWDEKAEEWTEEWNTTRQEQQGKLPPRVKVVIMFKDERDREVTLQTQQFIPMREVVQSYAN